MVQRSLVLPLCLAAAFASLAPDFARAQIVFLGVKGSGCAQIPNGGGNHVVNVTGAVPIGSRVVVSVAAAANIPLADPISDSAGNSYSGAIARFSDPVITKTYSQRTTHPLFAGATLTIPYTANGTGGNVASCAVVTAFSGVAAGPGLVASNGSDGMPSTNLSSGAIDTTGDLPVYVFVATFATNAATGGLGGFAPFLAVPPACSGGFCVDPFYRIVAATGAYQASGNSTNPVIWAGTNLGHRDARLFADGFEGGNTSAWSVVVP